MEGKLKETGRKAGRAKDNIRMRKMIVKRRGEAKGGQGKKSERRNFCLTLPMLLHYFVKFEIENYQQLTPIITINPFYLIQTNTCHKKLSRK